MVSIWRFVKNVRGFRAASSLVAAAAGGMPNSTLTAFVFSVVYPATSVWPVRINDRTWQPTTTVVVVLVPPGRYTALSSVATKTVLRTTPVSNHSCSLQSFLATAGSFQRVRRNKKCKKPQFRPPAPPPLSWKREQMFRRSHTPNSPASR